MYNLFKYRLILAKIYSTESNDFFHTGATIIKVYIIASDIHKKVFTKV